MENQTRELFDKYIMRQAQLNGVSPSAVTKRFNVDPTIQQKLEQAAMESDDFMRQVNHFPVKEQEGQKIKIGSKGPMASTNNSSDGTNRRNPAPNHNKEPQNYHCRKTNYDYALSYAELDAWAGHPEFQSLISNAMARQLGLDRQMIGFNGTHYSENSDRTTYPLLQDCGVGWLQKIRNEAPQRIMPGITLTSRDENNAVIASGTYGNIDAAVLDARHSLMDPWFRRAPGLVTVLSSDLLLKVNLPKVNALSQTSPNTELLAAQLIVSQEKIGGLPTVFVPGIPEDVVLITNLKNLSVYYQKGSLRRSIQEEPHYNRIATYQSSNDDYVIEEYGMVAMIDGVTFA
ncbi:MULTISPECIES: phage major capsid protein, P2 family [Klebsiella]|uniref:phage major capsid protein, P2 family n=1 Tax=Klebsiella TaxID=570 RepID=UPI001914BD06|nr:MULTISPECIES: phage major capsid protein, P2 family [Klebsiella]HDU4628830.1 phage major capsid protein, P2 family [Klebsiella pneumoniae subsp. pneumoniae]MBW3309456.1 phage major capsid protein, P2 family [Klebsiella pneumoniae]MCW9589634.1 phage major capsid protein, P2 family [Klebsiella oxytoca]MCW9600901.1 phage major capsid protein, P2 family [Klebsiella oxytoca]MCW9623795.1 phage major capsid protein, P2 family [Klebsiella oxytoca]